MEIKHRVAIVSLAFIASLTATAQDAAKLTVGELSDINMANVLKRAKLEGAELDKKIAEASSTTTTTSTGDVVARKPERVDPEPILRGVFGANGALTASFLIGKATSEFRQGDHLPGGYTLKELTDKRVVLCRAGSCHDASVDLSAPVATPSPTSYGPQPFLPAGASLPAMPSN